MFTQQMFDDLRGQAKSFSGLAAYGYILPATIGGQSEPERAWGQTVTANFFEVAALPMVLGRGFLGSEEREPVVVLSNSLWRRHFNQDAGIVGKTISLSGKKFTVVGVTAPGFRGINRLFDSRFWVPEGERKQLAGDAMNDLEPRLGGGLDVIARLMPGANRTQAQAELDAVAKRFAMAHPKEDEGLGFHIEQAGSLLPPQRAAFGAFLTALSVVTFLVLCIAASNVTNLLLVRAAAQHREMAVRIALGATRFQLIRPMLLESTLLALGGGLFGVVFCVAAVRGFTAIHLPLAVPIDLSLDFDWRVILVIRTEHGSWNIVRDCACLQCIAADAAQLAEGRERIEPSGPALELTRCARGSANLVMPGAVMYDRTFSAQPAKVRWS